MVSDNKIHRAFRTPKTLSTEPTRGNLDFHYLPKLYIGFNTNTCWPVCTFLVLYVALCVGAIFFTQMLNVISQHKISDK